MPVQSHNLESFQKDYKFEEDSGWKIARDLRLPVGVLISKQRQLDLKAEPIGIVLGSSL